MCDTAPKFEVSRMANDEHVRILKQGVGGWNKWRKENSKVWPDLINIDLSDVDLAGVNLFGADLRNANFRGALLAEADLFEANLNGANLSSTILSDANL